MMAQFQLYFDPLIPSNKLKMGFRVEVDLLDCSELGNKTTISYLSVQQSNLPSPSFIPLCATVKSTNPKFHTSLCNSQICHPRVSYIFEQQSNIPSLSFIPLYAAVKSAIPEFHTSLCNSQIYHPQVSYLSACATVKSTIPEFHTSLCSCQIYYP